MEGFPTTSEELVIVSSITCTHQEYSNKNYRIYSLFSPVLPQYKPPTDEIFSWWVYYQGYHLLFDE